MCQQMLLGQTIIGISRLLMRIGALFFFLQLAVIVVHWPLRHTRCFVEFTFFAMGVGTMIVEVLSHWPDWILFINNCPLFAPSYDPIGFISRLGLNGNKR